MPALPVSLIEPIWAQFSVLLPDHPVVVPTHPLGCHRRRVSDRVVFAHVVEALVHLDRGYDSGVTRRLLEERDLTGDIARRGVPAPVQAGMRWVVDWTSNCATSANTTKVYVYACTWRYEVTDTDPAKWYSGDQSQVIGRAKTGYYLGEPGMTHNYGSASSAFGFSPGSDVQQSSCTSLTFGLNGRGISVEATFPICPTILDVTS